MTIVIVLASTNVYTINNNHEDCENNIYYDFSCRNIHYMI